MESPHGVNCPMLRGLLVLLEQMGLPDLQDPPDQRDQEEGLSDLRGRKVSRDRLEQVALKDRKAYKVLKDQLGLRERPASFQDHKVSKVRQVLQGRRGCRALMDLLEYKARKVRRDWRVLMAHLDYRGFKVFLALIAL